MSKKQNSLTISYGAFSCTLDGFDDPLSAMREVATFFKELAADDPLFGANPIQADADLSRQVVNARRHQGLLTETDTQRVLMAKHRSALSASAAMAGEVHHETLRAQPSDEIRRDDPVHRVTEPQDAGFSSAAAFFAQTNTFVQPEDADDAAVSARFSTEDATGPESRHPPAGGVADRLERIRAAAARQEHASQSGSVAETSPVAAPSFASSEGSGEDHAVILQRIAAETSHQADEMQHPGAGAEPGIAVAPGFDAGESYSWQTAEEIAAPSAAVPPVMQEVVSERFDPPEGLDAPFPEKPGETEARTAHARVGGDEELEVSRLLVEAEHLMAEPESKTRRNAFAHLRAAVAARFADSSITAAAREDSERTERLFKDDLAETVVPRRPGTKPEPRTIHVEGERPAPLRLVASQRIDLHRSGDAVPVRQEFAPADRNGAAGSLDGFRAFTQETAADSPQDLVEAAVTYLGDRESDGTFSRAQVIDCLRAVQPENFSREDALRAIGQMLRAGRLVAREDGRYNLGEGSPAGGRAAM